MLYSGIRRQPRAGVRRQRPAAGLAAAALALVATAAMASDDGTFVPGDDQMAVANPPKVVLISLDGAKPELIERYLDDGVLPRRSGLGLLRRVGAVARQNVTATPSLTAVSHIAIATGSTAVNNDIPANSFHAVAATITTGISEFAAPIGGYDIEPLGPSPIPTAQPLWVRLRDAGKVVATATWPGGDGSDIKINNVIVQNAEPTRTTAYTVPFGTFGGLGATGFALTDADFAPDQDVADQLAAAGIVSFSPVLATAAPFETFYCASTTAGSCGTSPSASLDLTFAIRAAAIDTTDDGEVNYDELVFFDQSEGIQPGPFAAPATGPAYVKVGGPSRPFFFEGTGNVVGSAYYVSFLAPDLTTVRFARYSANYIPQNAPVLAAVDDINHTVGFWRPQPDYRIPERLSPGFADFPDAELEAMYEDQGATFIPYQARIGRRAIRENPDADLVMIYIEEPDGSGHQFTLTDPRQASNPLDPSSLGANQDPGKVARFERYLQRAYQLADRAVASVIDTVGVDGRGLPRSNIFVVSDHGMAPFHTAVNLKTLLTDVGIDTASDVLSVRTSGPAANIYVNLAGRESGGTVDAATYQTLVAQIAGVLRNAKDPNWAFNYTLPAGRLFSQVSVRPLFCSEGVGFCTSDEIGQDSGDVFAVMAEGYNFDGIQSPGVARLGDPPYDSATSVFSVPNFYGAHGYDPTLPSMSASFIAAGPAIRRHVTVDQVSNIDVAPTIMHLLGVQPSRTVDGQVLSEILR